MKKAKAVKILIPVIVLAVVLVMVILYGILTISIYNDNFNKRFETYEPTKLYVEDFDGLQRTRYEFPSDKGQKLVGYLYSTGETPRGIIVIAHGMGAGHNSYMDCANYFAHNGYDVFAYDATGNDESEGDGVGGVPQGVIDLDHAISFVEESGNFPDLPILLFGHSWGGYSVCNVLTYHPEVRAVIECSGCNSSSDLFEGGGKAQAPGFVIDTMVPIVKLYERVKFGRYAANTAMDGFAASDAPVMIVHSADDGVVPITYGYDRYYEKYQNDPRFCFVRYEDRGHNYIFDDMTYINEFNADFDKWMETLEYDCKAEENKERFQADRAEYFRQHLDRQRWSHMLDTEMFGRFVEFYNESLPE